MGWEKEEEETVANGLLVLSRNPPYLATHLGTGHRALQSERAPNTPTPSLFVARL